MSACHASWNMVTQQEIEVLVGFGLVVFGFFFLRKNISPLLPQVLLVLQALLNDARTIAAKRGTIPFEGDSNP